MSNDLYYGEALLTIRIIIHLVTAASILSWHSPDRTRLFTSGLAYLVAGGSMAAACQALLRFHTTAPNVEFPLVVVCGAFGLITVINGGNMAHLLSSTKRRLKNWMPKPSHKR